MGYVQITQAIHEWACYRTSKTVSGLLNMQPLVRPIHECCRTLWTTFKATYMYYLHVPILLRKVPDPKIRECIHLQNHFKNGLLAMFVWQPIRQSNVRMVTHAIDGLVCNLYRPFVQEFKDKMVAMGVHHLLHELGVQQNGRLIKCPFWYWQKKTKRYCFNNI